MLVLVTVAKNTIWCCMHIFWNISLLVLEKELLKSPKFEEAWLGKETLEHKKNPKKKLERNLKQTPKKTLKQAWKWTLKREKKEQNEEVSSNKNKNKLKNPKKSRRMGNPKK
jgi:hypothetical protein